MNTEMQNVSSSLFKLNQMFKVEDIIYSTLLSEMLITFILSIHASDFINTLLKIFNISDLTLSSLSI